MKTMKKRIVCLLLSVLSVLSMCILPVFAESEHVHDWSNLDGICAVCHEPCEAHNGVEATWYLNPEGGIWDSTTGTCKTCGYQCPHTFGYINPFVNDVCQLCGYRCTHDWSNLDGECKICHKMCVCTERIDEDEKLQMAVWGDHTGICRICGRHCEHQFSGVDQHCSICGALCEHAWDENGVCKLCGKECKHEILDEENFCLKCGYDTNVRLTIKYANLAFEDNVYILFAVKAFNTDEVPDFYIWKTGDGDYRIDNSDCEKLPLYQANYVINGEPYFVYVYTKLSAKQMTDSVYAKAFVSGAESNLLRYSILDYANSKIKTSDNQKLVKHLTNMLEYGTSAQELFGHSKSRLANDTYYTVTLKGATFADGSTKRLFKAGEGIWANAPIAVDWIVNGESVLSGETSLSIPEGVTEDTVIEAKKTYAVTVQSSDVTFGGVGTINATEAYPADVSFYVLNKITGENVLILNGEEIRAFPKKGYHFVDWEINGKRAQRNFYAYEGLTITAVFEPTLIEKAVLTGEENDRTLTFYCDNLDHNGEGTVYPFTSSFYFSWEVPWRDDDVRTVIFDESFFNSKMSSLMYFFCGQQNLCKVEGLENLNIENIVFFSYMFAGCESLTELDLTSFDTSDATCFDYMFLNCTSLKTILVSEKFLLDSCLDSTDMFAGCTSLVGGNGTGYSEFYVDETYARIDGENGLPGYFTALKITELGQKITYPSGLVNYVFSDGFTAAKVGDEEVIWVGEDFDGENAVWFALENTDSLFRENSFFSVRILTEEGNPTDYAKVFNLLGSDEKKNLESATLIQFSVEDPDGNVYNALADSCHILLPLDGDFEDYDTVSLLESGLDDPLQTEVCTNVSYPAGNGKFLSVTLRCGHGTLAFIRGNL